jgi:hypothetical protein
MMGACEKTKIFHPSDAGWSSMVLMNHSICRRYDSDFAATDFPLPI